MFTLYYDRNSYASQKVQVYFFEKNIQYKSHLFELLKQEHILDETYKLINPKSTVPALKDDDIIVCNSTEIMEYVSKKHLPKSDVFFDSTISMAVHNFCKEDEALHDPHIRTLSYNNLWMHNTKSTEEKNRLLNLAAKHPNKARGKFLARAVKNEFTPEEISLASTAITNAMIDVEQKLAKNKSGFLFGKEYTMADAVCTVRLFRFRRLGIKTELLKDKYPYTAAYYERLKQRTSFNKLLP
jgi:glutathione S-transferase